MLDERSAAMTIISRQRATLKDLYRVHEKAELVGGRIITLMPSGHLPSAIAGEIFVSLHAYAKARGHGHAYADGIGYAVPELPSGRESFSPDASFYAGALPANPMRFIEGAPTLAIEVRSEGDYDSQAQADIAAKRVDYFAAGTLVVWDVDPLAQTVTVYRSTDPGRPQVYGVGEVAEAEPAVPAWRMPLAEIFPE